MREPGADPTPATPPDPPPGPGGDAPDAAYLAAFAHATGGMVLTDLQGRVLTVNEAFRSRLAAAGTEAGDVPPASIEVPLPPDRTAARVVLEPEITGGVQLLLRPDGTPGWWLLTLDPPPAPDRLRDPLTGLADRRLLLERVALALSRRRAAENRVELVVLDVDEFKAVNDRYGHVVGDAVLVEVAARLAGCIRPSDLVARWGGDEFVVLLEEGEALGGRMVCERVEAALSEPVTAGGTSLQLSVSCGWVRADPADDAIALLHRADVQMYGVKSAHRQRRRSGEPLGDDDHLHQRLTRARDRSAALRTVATDAHARAQLVLDAVRQRREAAERID